MVEVYIPKKNVRGQLVPLQPKDDLPESVPLLRDLEKEVLNSLQHLERSIEELLQFDPEGEDQEIKEAAVENWHAVSVKKKRLERIQEKIKELESRQCGPLPERVADRENLLEAARLATAATPSASTGVDREGGVEQQLEAEVVAPAAPPAAAVPSHPLAQFGDMDFEDDEEEMRTREKGGEDGKPKPQFGDMDFEDDEEEMRTREKGGEDGKAKPQFGDMDFEDEEESRRREKGEDGKEGGDVYRECGSGGQSLDAGMFL
uniref:Uncharacterized protein n=1 Tax=Chromera velia CCMP2878 TaxID=1169474 RepID=A0A0G4FLH3_9ALVE|eukprot:Cvel_3498.t1-p1 / transcript=Cvel_3498.t1 / gene=Cvel_3498 / organism=Chromera_velia_CCMP2878 / gene_product=hypothetical protein / transcript_product=hypothetical protein / location=Cvel_scaffold141:100461-102304(-) / protein_length=260 / sequence_SO=supercontig / SO=protein_coding / is_pseudo=false